MTRGRLRRALSVTSRGARHVRNKTRWVWEFGALVLLVVLFAIIMFGR